jgi:hypothetical protein
MNRILLLALIAAPLMSACDAENPSSSQPMNNLQPLVPYEDSASSDIGPTSDTSGASVSVVNTTISEMDWETHTHTCQKVDDEHWSSGEPDTYSTIATGLDPNPRVFSVTKTREYCPDHADECEIRTNNATTDKPYLTQNGILRVTCDEIGVAYTVTLGY